MQIDKKLHFGAIQFVARWQIGILLQVLRAQRFGNGVFAAQPFAQVNQLTAVRAERRIRSGLPITDLLARWALDLTGTLHPRAFVWTPQGGHLLIHAVLHLTGDGFQVVSQGCSRVVGGSDPDHAGLEFVRDFLGAIR